jgi:hypothetical protein
VTHVPPQTHVSDAQLILEGLLGAAGVWEGDPLPEIHFLEDATAGWSGELRQRCTGNSFVAGTKVKMADGTAEPIEKIKVGDKVTNAQPDSSTPQTDTVTAVHVTYTDHDYDQLTVATPSGPRTITSAAEHLYWDATTHTWNQADNLNVGDQLDTSGNGHVTILTTKHYTALQATYNLTVNTTHTYYVLAGPAPVLVHNDDPTCWTIRSRLNAAGPGGQFGLPAQGKIRYLPPIGYNPANPLPRGSGSGYIDRFGNEWIVGPSHTKGQPFEWDVQLSKKGKAQLG